MSDGIDHSVERAKATIEEMVLAAEEEANKVCQPFYDRVREIRETVHPRDWFKYSVSVRPESRPDGTTRVRITWMELKWIKMDNGNELTPKSWTVG